MNSKKTFLYTFLVLVLIFTSQCTQVPLTGRSQVSLVSNSQIFPSSFSQYDQVKGEAKLIEGTAHSKSVKKVGKRIQQAVEQYFIDNEQPNYLKDYQWEFNLLEGDAVNAWCMPGGKVAFYTGIMPICDNEEGIAVVMGHEVAHAIANHGRERMSQQTATQTGLNLANAALGNGATSQVSSDMIMRAAGAATSLGILAFSRKHESEADELGLYFMAMAGYNPRVAPKFWERMSSSASGGAPPEFLSTHPSHNTRIQGLNNAMPKALVYYNKSTKSK